MGKGDPRRRAKKPARESAGTARAGRPRRLDVERHPSGQIKRESVPPPVVRYRMRTYGLSEADASKDIAGTEIGRMLLAGPRNGGIAEEQFEACVLFYVTRRQWTMALNGPSEATAIDLDRIAGRLHADTSERDMDAAYQWDRVLGALHTVHPTARRTIERVVLGDQPVRPSERQMFFAGCNALVKLWKLGRADVDIRDSMDYRYSSVTSCARKTPQKPKS